MCRKPPENLLNYNAILIKWFWKGCEILQFYLEGVWGSTVLTNFHRMSCLLVGESAKRNQLLGSCGSTAGYLTNSLLLSSHSEHPDFTGTAGVLSPRDAPCSSQATPGNRVTSGRCWPKDEQMMQLWPRSPKRGSQLNFLWWKSCLPSPQSSCFGLSLGRLGYRRLREPSWNQKVTRGERAHRGQQYSESRKRAQIRGQRAMTHRPNPAGSFTVASVQKGQRWGVPAATYGSWSIKYLLSGPFFIRTLLTLGLDH